MRLFNKFIVLLLAVTLSYVSCSKDDVETTTPSTEQEGYKIVINGATSDCTSKSSFEGSDGTYSYVWESTDVLYGVILDPSGDPILFNNDTQIYSRVAVTPDGDDSSKATLQFSDLTLAEEIPAGSTIHIATATNATAEQTQFTYTYTSPVVEQTLEALADSHVIYGSCTSSFRIDLTAGDELNEAILFDNKSTIIRIDLVNGDRLTPTSFNDFKVTCEEIAGVQTTAHIALADGKVTLGNSAVSTLIDRVGETIYLDADGTKSYYVSIISDNRYFSSYTESDDTVLFTITAGGKTASVTKGDINQLKSGVLNTFEFTVPATSQLTGGVYMVSDFNSDRIPEGDTWEIYSDTENYTLSQSDATGLLYALNNASTPINLIFGDNITTLASKIFQDVTNLNSVTFENSITLNANEFNGCTGITGEVDLSNVTGTIPSNCFLGCTNITKIILNPAITNIAGNAFENCTSLETFIYGEGVPQPLTLQSYVFANCSSLQSLDLSGVTSLKNYTFEGCDMLTTLNLTTTETLSLTTNVFSNSEDSTYNEFDTTKCALYLDDANLGTTVPSESSVWSGKTWLSINGITPEVEDVAKSYSLAEFNNYLNTNGTNLIPDGSIWYITDTNIGTNSDESALTFADIDSGNYAKSTFGLCASAAAAGRDLTICFTNATAFNNFAMKGCAGVVAVEIKSVTQPGQYAFSECDDLESVTVSVNAKNFGSYLFYNSPSFSQLNYSADLSTRTETVLTINTYVFYGTALTSLTIPAHKLGNYIIDGVSLTTFDLSYSPTDAAITHTNEGNTFKNFTNGANCTLYLNSTDYLDVSGEGMNVWCGVTWSSIVETNRF